MICPFPGEVNSKQTLTDWPVTDSRCLSVCLSVCLSLELCLIDPSTGTSTYLIMISKMTNFDMFFQVDVVKVLSHPSNITPVEIPVTFSANK